MANINNNNFNEALEYFDLHHGHAPPRNVLMEPSFAAAGNSLGITDFKQALETFFHGPVFLRTTKCADAEAVAFNIVTGETERIACAHVGYRDPVQCCKERVGQRNPFHYVVATGRHAGSFDQTPGTPILTFQNGVMVVPNPSNAQTTYVNETNAALRETEMLDSKARIGRKIKNGNSWKRRNMK